MSRRAALLHPPVAPGFARPGTAAQYAPDVGLEPTHIHLNLAVDLDERTVVGDVTHTVVQRARGWRTLTLDAVGFSSVEVTGSAPLRFRYDGDRIHVVFDHAPPLGATATVTVKYRVHDPLVGLVFRGHTGALGEEPCIVATDHETERARYWLPCVDHPSVRTTLSFAITADARLVALANGAEQGREEHDNGLATTRWALDRRCPSYLLCFVVGDLVSHREAPLNGASIGAFAPRPYTAAQVERSFGDTRSLIEWITTRLDSPLPWPKYFQFAAPRIGGAMENISLVSWDDAFVADERLHAELGDLIRIVNLHELAHTWFGDRVVCRDFAHSWLKESWATYMEAVWLDETADHRTATAWLLTDHKAYTDESDTRYARPIVTRRFNSSWDLFDGHLYPGGAWRLHMLRQLIGDDAFWAGTHAYLKRFDGEVVETDDFRREMERASGRSLARFFDQWLHAPGYPKLKASWSHDASKGLGTLSVTQTQEDEGKGIGLFTFPLEVAIQTESGSWLRETLQVDDRTASLTVRLEHAPKQVVVDPDAHTLHGLEFDPGLDLLTATLQHGQSLRGCLHAVKTLAKKGRVDGMMPVLQAYRAEPVPAQRKLYAAALGASGSAAALEVLLALLQWETDPRAMGGLTAALGHYRDPQVAMALTAWLELPDRPYRATASALQALGKQRDPGHVDILTVHADSPGWWGWVARGALQGLGENASEEALSALRHRIESGGLADNLRPAALEALGTCARRLSSEHRATAGELLQDFVRHPDHNTRLAAGRGLVSLGEPGGLSALATLRQGVSVQHVAAVDRLVDRLKKAGGASATAKLEGQVSELSDQLRALQERLDKLEAAGSAKA